MGLTFATEARGPFATILPPQRKLLLDAMKAAGVGWVVRAKDCPDCQYAHVTRASVAHVCKKVREHVVANPKYLARDTVRWKNGGTSRDVLLRVVDYLSEEAKALSDAVVIVEDDLKMCDHSNVGKRKRTVKK